MVLLKTAQARVLCMETKTNKWPGALDNLICFDETVYAERKILKVLWPHGKKTPLWHYKKDRYRGR